MKARGPAFLFYFRDFLASTELMKPEEVGMYIRILCHMADKGRLSMEHMLTICRAISLPESIKNKLNCDKNSLFFQKRLAEEIKRRYLYTESRRKNAGAYAKHMDNENTNGKLQKTKTKTKFIKPTLLEVKDYCTSESLSVIPEGFIDFYESKGWIVGSTGMKDWKAALRRWARSDFNKPLADNSDVPLQFRTKR